MPANIRACAEDIIKQKPRLPAGWTEERVRGILTWAIQRGSFKTRIMSVNGDVPALSEALLIVRSPNRCHLASPFGTFEDFKRACEGRGGDDHRSAPRKRLLLVSAQKDRRQRHLDQVK